MGKVLTLVAAASMTTGGFTLAQGSLAQAALVHDACGNYGDTTFETTPNFVQGQPQAHAHAHSMVTFLNNSVSNNVTIDNYSRVNLSDSPGNFIAMCGNGGLVALKGTNADHPGFDNTIEFFGVGDTFNGMGALNQQVVANGFGNTITNTMTPTLPSRLTATTTRSRSCRPSTFSLVRTSRCQARPLSARARPAL